MTPKLMMILAGAATLSAMSVGTTYAQGQQLRYAPSELSTLSGTEEVYSRIHEAAIELCGEEYGGFRLVTHKAERERCVVEVVREFVSEIDHPRLDQVHADAALRL